MELKIEKMHLDRKKTPILQDQGLLTRAGEATNGLNIKYRY